MKNIVVLRDSDEVGIFWGLAEGQLREHIFMIEKEKGVELCCVVWLGIVGGRFKPSI